MNHVEMCVILKDSDCTRHDIMFAVLALIVAILVISAIVDHLNRKCLESPGPFAKPVRRALLF